MHPKCTKDLTDKNLYNAHVKSGNRKQIYRNVNLMSQMLTRKFTDKLKLIKLWDIFTQNVTEN